MDTAVIVAIISLVGTLGGSFGGVLVSSKLTNYRLQQLENKVQEHNNYARRLPVVEDGRLVGIVSLADLARSQRFDMEAAQALGEISENIIHRRF